MHSKRLCSQDFDFRLFQRTIDFLEKNQENRTGGLFVLDFLPLIRVLRQELASDITILDQPLQIEN